MIWSPLLKKEERNPLA